MYLTTLDPISRDFDRIVRRAFAGSASRNGFSGTGPGLLAVGISAIIAAWVAMQPQRRTCRSSVALSTMESMAMYPGGKAVSGQTIKSGVSPCATARSTSPVK